MMSLKKNQQLSKTILFLSLSTMLLINTLPIQATIGDALRKAGSAVYEKVRGFDKTIVFDKLLQQIEKLGTQVGDIKDCMLYRYECTPAKRAAFYGTAIAILALTATVVGFTITIAATSEEPDQDLKQTIDTTSKKTMGLRPAAVFQRLATKLTQFRQHLVDMKTCLVKRTCTKRQKRALYVAAGTIAGLVTIALGLGIGSYIYAKHKREQEETALPGELPGAEKEGIRPTITFQFDETQYQEDQSPFHRFFRQVVALTQEGSALLSRTYQETKEQVQSGLLKTKESVSNAFLTLLEKGRDFAALLKEILEVNITKLHEAFTKAKERLEVLRSSITDQSTQAIRASFTHQALDLAQYVKNILDAVDLIKPLGTSTTHAVSKIVSIEGKKRTYLEDVIRVRREEYRKRNIPLAAVREAEEDLKIKDFIAIDNLKAIYPTLHQKINALDLRKLGDVAHKIASGLAALVHAAQTIHTQAGNIGLVISDSKIQPHLQALESKINQLGNDIQQAFNVDRIIEAELMTTTELAKALVEAASSDGFKFLRQNWSKLKAVISAFQEIDQRVDKIKFGIRDFKEYMKNLQQDAKERFIASIKRNPAFNIPHAGKILRHALATAVKTTKEGLAKLIGSSSQLLTKLKNIMPDTYLVLYNLNEYMRRASLSNQPLFNTQFLDGLGKVANTITDTANSAESLAKEVQAETAG